jgi:hypothetical protein
MDAVMAATRYDEWIPIRVFWRDAHAWVDWCHFGRTRLAEPFFRDSVAGALRQPFNQAFRRETPVEALAEWRLASPGIEPTAFLYHASRCGSTLVSQMLAALGTHIVVSEPPMIDAILATRRMSPPVPEAVRIEWLRGMVSALAQPRNGETRFFVKLDAWNVFDLAVLRQAFPRTPWIYLYRDPLEIAVSQLHERGAYLAQGMVGPTADLIAPADALAMPAEEFIARVLGRMLEAAAAGSASHGGRLVHYGELPEAMWAGLRDVLGIGADSAAREALQRAARWNAKSPQLEFSTDSERKQRAATDAVRAANERWAAPAYRALEGMRLAARAARGDADRSARSPQCTT